MKCGFKVSSRVRTSIFLLPVVIVEKFVRCTIIRRQFSRCSTADFPGLSF
ncbi:hypothetical protein Gohar_008330 [Gossypium harknessii]|uniref:Uncharacterized protein n=1 Tax=Gossypium harknessii TaxID=34285 RepID=A0A7J9GJC4_9ROSI|nr:hypothetical protein [Gossypium harknessii]